MNRRFEMYQYRHIVVRMRLGESDRQIDAAGLMGRRAVAKLRKKVLKFGWLGLEQPLPSEQDLLSRVNYFVRFRDNYDGRLRFSGLLRYFLVFPPVIVAIDFKDRGMVDDSVDGSHGH